jgi:hypothetical protein
MRLTRHSILLTAALVMDHRVAHLHLYILPARAWTELLACARTAFGSTQRVIR